MLAHPRVGDCRQALGEAVGLRREQCGDRLLQRRTWHDRLYQRHGVVDEYAGGLAIFEEDLPAGDKRLVADAGPAHRLRIGQQCVAVNAAQDDGLVGEERIQLFPGRIVFHFPVILVPSPAGDPIRRVPFTVRHNTLQHLLKRTRAHQVGSGYQVQPVSQKMAVTVVETGIDRFSLRIDDAFGLVGIEDTG